MYRRALFVSLPPLALAGLAGLIALVFDPETTARLATQLGQSALNTGRGVAPYLGRAASLSTVLFVTLAWVAAGGFHAFVAHRDPSDTRTTAGHAFALVASATVPLVAIFARDRLVVVAGVGAAFLAGAGAVFAGRSNVRGVVTRSLYAVTPVVDGDVVASPVAGPVVVRTATLALPLAAGYTLGVTSARGRLHLDVAVPTLAFAAPAWTCFLPATKVAGFDPETVDLALGFVIAATLLSLPFVVTGYATTRTADVERQTGASSAMSAVEQ